MEYRLPGDIGIPDQRVAGLAPPHDPDNVSERVLVLSLLVINLLVRETFIY